MERGFTIIELMIVVALIGIVGAMAMPSFTAMIDNNRRVAAVNDLLSTIHYARSEAITRNQRISICRSNAAKDTCVTSGGNGWRDGWIIFWDREGTGVFSAAQGDEILRAGDGLRGTLDFSSTQYGNSITFMPNGRVVGTGGTILLCETGSTTAVRSIVIDRTGRPRSIGEPGGACT